MRRLIASFVGSVRSVSDGVDREKENHTWPALPGSVRFGWNI